MVRWTEMLLAVVLLTVSGTVLAESIVDYPIIRAPTIDDRQLCGDVDCIQGYWPDPELNCQCVRNPIGGVPIFVIKDFSEISEVPLDQERLEAAISGSFEVIGRIECRPCCFRDTQGITIGPCGICCTFSETPVDE